MWFQSGPLDMAWVNKFVVMGLMVLHKMNHFHACFNIGEIPEPHTLSC